MHSEPRFSTEKREDDDVIQDQVQLTDLANRLSVDQNTDCSPVIKSEIIDLKSAMHLDHMEVIDLTADCKKFVGLLRERREEKEIREILKNENPTWYLCKELRENYEAWMEGGPVTVLSSP